MDSPPLYPIEDPPEFPHRSGLSRKTRIILVLSGKGGVGKSTVTAYLARYFWRDGLKVGVLDVDLCGPSIPYILDTRGKTTERGENGWKPVFADEPKRLKVMSIGYLLENQDDAVVWRGPKKNAMIKQFVNDVDWGDIDYLIVDTPPGTSDEHMAVMEALQPFRPNGAVLVTTPQAASVADVRRQVTFCRRLELPVIGIVENMSGYVCPHCKECTNIFSKGGGKKLAELCQVGFLGEIPMEPISGPLTIKTEKATENKGIVAAIAKIRGQLP